MIKVATNGNSKFFLGTDTAPHFASDKENCCGCAGIFNASYCISILTQIFEDEKQAVIDAKERPETVNFLVGKVMQKTKGKADPVKTLELIKSKLNQ